MHQPLANKKLKNNPCKMHFKLEKDCVGIVHFVKYLDEKDIITAVAKPFGFS